MVLLPQPGDDEVKRVRVEAGDRLIVGFDPRATEVELAEGHLVLRFPSGAILILEGFAEAAMESGAVAVQLPDGRMIDGAYIAEIAAGLQNLVPLETAAGEEIFEAPEGGGGSTYSDSLGDIVDEIESLVQAGLFAPTAIDVRAAAPVGSFEVAATSQFFDSGLAAGGSEVLAGQAGGDTANSGAGARVSIVESSDQSSDLEFLRSGASGPSPFESSNLDPDDPVFMGTNLAMQEAAENGDFRPEPQVFEAGFLGTGDPKAGDSLLIEYNGPDSGSLSEVDGKLVFAESAGVWRLTLDVSTKQFIFEFLMPYQHDTDETGSFADQQFKFTLFGSDGTESLSGFQVRLLDDVPVANDDVFDVAGTSVSGNVVDSNGDIGNDDLGADGARVSHVGFGTLNLAVPTGGETTTIAGEFGTLRIDAEGTFTYDLGTTTPPQSNDKETFSYTLTDGDGDTDTAELTIDLDSISLTTVASLGDGEVIPFEALVDPGDDTLVELSSIDAAMRPGPPSTTSDAASPDLPVMPVSAGEVPTVTIAELIERIDVQVM